MKVYGLAGYPLVHSFSKKYYTEKFEKENLDDHSFELFPLTSIEHFPQIIEGNKNLCGLAVTIPYKQAVIPYMDLLDDTVKKCGAVNCIKISGKVLAGYNTDTVGFEKTLVPLLKQHHTQALILGDGGAAKAVQYVLLKSGINFLVATRNLTFSKNHISYSSIDEKIIAENRLIINCTPVGMFPADKGYPEIPYQYLTSAHLLYDLVYSPPLTVFLQKGLEKGATIKNGFDMLVTQAEENWRIWNEL